LKQGHPKNVEVALEQLRQQSISILESLDSDPKQKNANNSLLIWVYGYVSVRSQSLLPSRYREFIQAIQEKNVKVMLACFHWIFFLEERWKKNFDAAERLIERLQGRVTKEQLRAQIELLRDDKPFFFLPNLYQEIVEALSMTMNPES